MLEAGKKRASEARASSVIKSALACVRESPKDGARVPVHNLTKVHGDGEQEDQKEKVHSKDRVQQSAQRLWRKHAEVHPDKDDDGEDGEHANDDAGGAFGPVRGCEGLLDEGELRVRIFHCSPPAEAFAKACVSMYSRIFISLPFRTVMSKTQSSLNVLFVALIFP